MFTKANGSLDRKRNEAWQEMLAEEESRLRAFDERKQKKKSKRRVESMLDVLAGAAEMTEGSTLHLLTKAAAATNGENTGVVARARLRALARAAYEAQLDDDEITRPVNNCIEEESKCVVPKRRPPEKKKKHPKTWASSRQVPPQQSSVEAAKQYIERMQNVHEVDTKVILSFARCLKAFHENRISRDTVTETVTDLLKDYPDLIRDFYKFLPKQKKTTDNNNAPPKNNNDDAAASTNNKQQKYFSPQEEEQRQQKTQEIQTCGPSLVIPSTPPPRSYPRMILPRPVPAYQETYAPEWSDQQQRGYQPVIVNQPMAYSPYYTPPALNHFLHTPALAWLVPTCPEVTVSAATANVIRQLAQDQVPGLRHQQTFDHRPSLLVTTNNL